jgi:hypothetical protein
LCSNLFTTSSPQNFKESDLNVESETTFANSESIDEPVHISNQDDHDDNECSDDMEEPLSDDDNVDGDTSDTEELELAIANSKMILDSNAPWNNLTKFLSEWASSSRCSQASMTNLMAGLRELNCTAGHFLPNILRLS